MTFDDIYGAVDELYDRDAAWDELVTVGSRESLNLAEEAVGRHADSDETGLRIRDFETGEHEAYSFAELNEAADRVANYLVAHTRLHDRIGVMLQPSLELYAAAFGTLKAGRIWVSLDVLFGPDVLTYQAHDSGMTVLFTSSEHVEKIDPDRVPALERVVVVDGTTADERGHVTVDPYATVAAGATAFETVATHPNDVHKILYSSGTTGQPKGVPITHGWPVFAHHAYVKYVLDLRPTDTCFVAVSPAWGYGSFFGTVTPGMVGTAIGSYRGRFDPEQFLETLVEWGVTNAFAPPTALRQIRAADLDTDPSEFDLRVLATAGEALDEDTSDWCREHFGVRPLDAYGASEIGLILCNYSFPDWESKPGSMGKPLPGREVALLDDDGSEVETGELGEVAVRRQTEAWGDHCGEYWGQPAASLDLFEGPWLRVGDLARCDADGYYWYYARKDAVINSAGHRIGPGEVEETLLTHDAVSEVCVVGVPDETRGERIKAFVALVEGESPSEDLRADITTFARSQLSKYAYPREIEFLSELPKTATGKIARSALEQRHSVTDGG
jgi:acetyl-CoA synthetase